MNTDIYDTPEYQKFLAECAEHCHCSHGICGGVLAGGFCDNLDYSEDNHDDYYRYTWEDDEY